MAFLYRAFVRKNSPELRKVLENMGYRNGAMHTLYQIANNKATNK